MVLSLNYSDLSGCVTQANKLSNEIDQYCNELSNKVQQKMYSVEGGMSSALNNADYYIRTKINALRGKSANTKNLASLTQTLLDTAKRVDNDVKSTIEANQKNFFKKNPNMKAPWYKRAAVSFFCDMKNVPVLGLLFKGGEVVASAIDTAVKDIKYWWKCGGGEQIVMNCVDIVVKVAGAALAVVAAVSAIVALAAASVITFGGVLVAAAACVTAVIAVVNATTNIVTSVQSIVASNSGDLVMSKIYNDRDTLAQVLREHNFHDPKANRASNNWAAGIEITEAVAGVITLVHSVGKIAGSFLSKNGVGFAFKELARGKDGKLTKKVTLKSIWKGTKSLFLNKKLTTSTSKGLMTTLVNNVKESLKHQGVLFKLALRDPIKYIKTKEVGDLGFFRNIAEKCKLNFNMFKNTAFQFKNVETLKDFQYNVQKINNLLSATSDVINNIKLVLSGAANEDGKGLIRRLSEKFVKDKFFNNDFSKLFNTIGLSKLLIQFDKSGIIKDYTGVKDGIIQKIQSIPKSLKHPRTYASKILPVTFRWYEHGLAGAGAALGANGGGAW